MSKVFENWKVHQSYFDKLKKEGDEDCIKRFTGYANDLRFTGYANDLTGRIIFCKGENFPYNDEYDFFCGPETRKSWTSDLCLSDHFDVYEELQEIFKDMPEIVIGAAENYHTFVPVNKTGEETWEIIKSRLEEAGAIYRKDMEPPLGEGAL